MFVTFEGPEGAGKSSAMTAVASGLRERGIEVVETREPGAGTVGAKVRELLLHGGSLSAETELFLFLADRANNVANIVEPALEKGMIVLCDRHADSTLVYQGLARGQDENFVRHANRVATKGLAPDLTLLFDLPSEIGLARLTHKDRLDSEPIEFHRIVREGFLKLAKAEPQRWIVVDATAAPEIVAAEALSHVLLRVNRLETDV